MKCCIKHIKGSYILWDTKDQNPLIQIELLLTETLWALSLHTEALQDVYKKMPFTAQFSDKNLEPLQCIFPGFL